MVQTIQNLQHVYCDRLQPRLWWLCLHAIQIGVLVRLRDHGSAIVFRGIQGHVPGLQLGFALTNRYHQHHDRLQGARDGETPVG